MFAYLMALVISISGLVLLDRQYKLAFWHDWPATLKTISTVMAIFVLWDFAGIALGIFFSGESRWALPFTLLPEFPVEELFFLFLLCYVTLLTYEGVRRKC